MRHDGYHEPVLQLKTQQSWWRLQNGSSDGQPDKYIRFIDNQCKLDLLALIRSSHWRVENDPGIVAAPHLAVAGVTVTYCRVTLQSSKDVMFLFTDIQITSTDFIYSYEIMMMMMMIFVTLAIMQVNKFFILRLVDSKLLLCMVENYCIVHAVPTYVFSMSHGTTSWILWW